jgi:hypothetical protein
MGGRVGAWAGAAKFALSEFSNGLSAPDASGMIVFPFDIRSLMRNHGAAARLPPGTSGKLRM